MLGFMDLVQQAWAASTGWDGDNSYGALTGTARALLDFVTPVGLTLHCSSLASRSFANSYTLGNAGAVDGSLAYLYTSRPLPAALQQASASPDLPLRALVRGYRELAEDERLAGPGDASAWEIWQAGRRVDTRDTLLYGRLYLPQARLEALYLRRLSPAAQLKIACVSSSQLRNGGSVLFLLQRDLGRFSSEFLYSTDGGLLGVRGLYNFGPGPQEPSSAREKSRPSVAVVTKEPGEGPEIVLGQQQQQQPPNGRFSAGGELYYGALNKTGGVSLGCRFATLPRHKGFPYTMTLTLNPLMGNLSSTYAVKAGPSLALATRFDFNVYSYESEYQVGFELWKKKRELDGSPEDVQWAIDKIKESERKGWISERTKEAAGKMMGGFEAEDANMLQYGVVPVTRDGALAKAMAPMRDEDTAGVLKGRVNQNGVLGVLWEGRVKQLLYTFGLNVDFRQREQIFRGVGIEFHYSS